MFRDVLNRRWVGTLHSSTVRGKFHDTDRCSWKKDKEVVWFQCLLSPGNVNKRDGSDKERVVR